MSNFSFETLNIFLSRKLQRVGSEERLLGRLWWDSDRGLFLAVLGLASVGILVMLSVTEPMGRRMQLAPYYLFYHHLVYVALALAAMIGVSRLSLRQLLVLSWVVFVAALVLSYGTILFGTAIKGAQRWLYFFGLSFQPSEFLKPAMIVLLAYEVDRWAGGRNAFFWYKISVAYCLMITPLALQPDIGSSILLTALGGSLLFLGGISRIFVIALPLFLALGIFLSYHFLSHVHYRIDLFLHAGQTNAYQIRRSLEALSEGGLWGQGSGLGAVKWHLPDAHTDFVFSILAEEWGLLGAVAVMLLYGFILWRGFRVTGQQENLFLFLASAGLTLHYGFQFFINILSDMQFIPAKGMTLPWISYGGSSLLESGLTTGLLLALSRRHLLGEVSFLRFEALQIAESSKK